MVPFPLCSQRARFKAGGMRRTTARRRQAAAAPSVPMTENVFSVYGSTEDIHQFSCLFVCSHAANVY